VNVGTTTIQVMPEEAKFRPDTAEARARMRFKQCLKRPQWQSAADEGENFSRTGVAEKNCGGRDEEIA